MSFTSDEVNYLIYRYLEESGLRHSAFTLANESLLAKSAINGADVLPGALVALLQKGLQYIDVEWHLTEDGVEVECDATPTLLSALKGRPVDAGPPVAKSKDRDARGDSTKRKGEASKDAKGAKEKRPKTEDGVPSAAAGAAAAAAAATGTSGATYAANAQAPEPAEPEDDSDLNLISESDVTILRGHESEVLPYLARRPGSGLHLLLASTAIVASVSIPEGATGAASGPISPPIVMAHPINVANKDVTSLEWSPSGAFLATGAYDGAARIWSSKGELLRTLTRHRGPIFSLKWNKSMDSLLSGSVDRTAIIWDPATGDVRQQFEFHAGPTLDVDWRDNTSFASCSGDQTVMLCKLGETKPVKVFRGHKSDVNAVKWDPTGSVLASCSDDMTAKIWSVKSDNYLFDLREHTQQIYTVKWNPVESLLLASASFDSTVRLWDANVGKRLHTLTRHRGPVYSVAFSPDGKYLASGAFDNCLMLWSVKDGTLIRTYRGKGGIYEVAWNSNGTKLAACYADSTVTKDLRGGRPRVNGVALAAHRVQWDGAVVEARP